MNLMGACVLIAVEAAAKAVGVKPQSIFSDDARWLWWVLAAWWAFHAVGFLMRCFKGDAA